MKLSSLNHLKACAQRVENYVLGLLRDVTSTTADALEELDNVKADKPIPTPYTIPTTGWVKGTGADADADYPYYYDIVVVGVTAADVAEIDLPVISFDAVKACGLCPTNETLAGKIRIRAVSIPTTTISAQYTITEGLTPEQAAERAALQEMEGVK